MAGKVGREGRECIVVWREGQSQAVEIGFADAPSQEEALLVVPMSYRRASSKLKVSEWKK